jgi:hypothetical protein
MELKGNMELPVSVLHARCTKDGMKVYDDVHEVIVLCKCMNVHTEVAKALNKHTTV